MGEVGELLKHLGYGTSVLYALAAYRLFNWLDANVSDDAKAALANIGGRFAHPALRVSRTATMLGKRPML
jgi:hypothetical protein